MNWKIFSVIAMILFSIMTLMIISQVKKGLSVPFIMFIIAIIWLVGYGYLMFKEGVSFSLPASTISALLIIGILSFSGNLLSFYAIIQAPNPGYASAINSCSIVIITVASILLGNSPKINLMEIAGISMCFGGIVLLNLSK